MDLVRTVLMCAAVSIVAILVFAGPLRAANRRRADTQGIRRLRQDTNEAGEDHSSTSFLKKRGPSIREQQPCAVPPQRYQILRDLRET